jgi:hypothetical protein
MGMCPLSLVLSKVNAYDAIQFVMPPPLKLLTPKKVGTTHVHLVLLRD